MVSNILLLLMSPYQKPHSKSLLFFFANANAKKTLEITMIEMNFKDRTHRMRPLVCSQTKTMIMSGQWTYANESLTNT